MWRMPSKKRTNRLMMHPTEFQKMAVVTVLVCQSPLVSTCTRENAVYHSPDNSKQ